MGHLNASESLGKLRIILDLGNHKVHLVADLELFLSTLLTSH